MSNYASKSQVNKQPSGRCQPSAEQLQRMEENKRKAQAKLAAKRACPLTTSDHSRGSVQLPPAKKLAYSTTPQSITPKLAGSSIISHKPNSISTLAGKNFTSNQTSQSLNSGHPSTSSYRGTHPLMSEPVTNHHLSHTIKFQDSFHSKSSSSSATRSVPPASQSAHKQSTLCCKPIPHTAQNALIKAAASNYNPPMKPSSTSHNPPSSVKCTQLKERKKARVYLVSKTRFEVNVQYESSVIEIFKKMPTRAYNTKSTMWSFGIEDYHCLVQAIQSDCKHVELDLIPKPVIKLFLSQLQTKPGSGSSSWTHSRTSSVEWSKIEPKLCHTLMQFQREGVEFAVRRGGCALIADDMGLGKTLQAIAVMSHYRSDWPLLIVCPSSVRFTWAEAFKRWIPSLSESDVNVFLASKSCGSFCLVNIISYDLLVKMSKEVLEQKFSSIIADESHFLKNSRTARSKAAIPVIKNARRAVLLSGTPALSRPIELYNQIIAIDKSFRSVSYYQFGLRYCNGVKNQFGWDFSGASNMSELQLYLEDAIMIRRLKSEVLDQLPSKTRKVVLLDISNLKAGGSKEWKDYKQQLNDASKLRRIERSSALLPLFDMTGKMKLPAVKDYVLDMLEGGRKIIVFGHHLAVLNGLCEALDKKSYQYIRIDGKTPADVRQSLCDQFQHREECLVAVLSITTASAGLTLTAASTVIFAELFWNPGILVQAEDRAYRIGQKSSVNVHYLIAKDTVDDFIWPLIQSKLSVLSQAGLAKNDFSTAESSVVPAKDATQKTLMDCFGTLMSQSELDQVSNFDDTLEFVPPDTSTAT